MYAKKCDRCGDFYVPQRHDEYYYIVAVRKKTGATSNQDLCPGCEAFLTAWMKFEEDKEEAENAGES